VEFLKFLAQQQCCNAVHCTILRDPEDKIKAIAEAAKRKKETEEEVQV